MQGRQNSAYRSLFVSDRIIPIFSLPDQLPADPVLADLIPEFVRQWMHDFNVTWNEIKSSGNIEDFRRFGHTVKGSFLQFGFKGLSGVGIEIMNDSAKGDWETADLRVKGLIQALETISERWG